MFLLLEYDGSTSACFQVITAAGNVKHEDIVEQAKKLFNKLSTDPTSANMLVAKEPASFTGSEVGSAMFALYLVLLFVISHHCMLLDRFESLMMTCP